MQRLIDWQRSRNNARYLQRMGMAALETVMIIGAMLPVAVLLFVLIRYALRLIHSLIANLTGSPLL
jgi:hypothetical protein